MIREHPLPKLFLNALRSNNLAFQFTSLRANEIAEGNFLPAFKIQGQIYYVTGSLQPVNNDVPKSLQCTSSQIICKRRKREWIHISHLDRTLVRELQNLLHAVNP